jgi:hypothetical protein
MEQFYYPVETLLTKPTVFLPIAVQLKRYFDPDELRGLFFEAYAAATNPENTGDPSGEDLPEEVCFSIEEREVSGHTEITLSIIMDNNIGMIMKGRSNRTTKEEPHVSIVTSENDLKKVSQIYRSIVSRLEKELPEYQGDICLSEIPNPTNNFLQDQDNKGTISGSFSLLSDPSRQFAFEIRYDPASNKTETLIVD